jgi:hypothetical protein
MNDLSSTRATLDRAVADVAESARLHASLTSLRREVEAAREQLAAATRRHGLEADDVRRLEGIGWSALAAAVRGTRTGELDRERAEEVRARLALQTATERVTALEARRDETEQRLARLGDVAGRRERAAAAHADAVRASGAAPGLEAVLDELAALEAESGELEEAVAAGRRARTALDEARDRLGSADSWSAYDTWMGGGMLSSMVKHDRLDEAGARIEAAQRALADFTRELGDVGSVQALSADLGISPMTRTVDVFFDNIFSDLSVRGQIKSSLDAVDAARVSVGRALDGLTARAADLHSRRADLLRRRDELAGV